MKTLQFAYEMQTSFTDPIRDHHYTLKCRPKDSERQLIRHCRVTIDPECRQVSTEDSFHNSMIFGSVLEPHDHFAVTVSGVAVTGLAEREMVREPQRLGSFRVQSGYTQPGERLKQYFKELALENEERPFQKALSIMQHLECDFQYRQGITGVGTTAEEAWTLGGGVCQDWCHIMLSLCRMAQIPCRYVVGMLIGEGYSHAWVEIEEDGFWYAMDPTNHLVVNEDHIKISSGRDYHDCVVTRGIFFGGRGQTQKIGVTVLPV